MNSCRGTSPLTRQQEEKQIGKQVGARRCSSYFQFLKNCLNMGLSRPWGRISTCRDSRETSCSQGCHLGLLQARPEPWRRVLGTGPESTLSRPRVLLQIRQEMGNMTETQMRKETASRTKVKFDRCTNYR